jgi:hypothetical protein
MTLEEKLIACAVIGAMFIVILVVAGIGSVGSSAGHFVKDTLNGTVVEQPAASIEKAGADLTASANHAFAFLTGMLVLGGLIWIGANKK